MIDKSNDHLIQNSVFPMWYMRKTVDGGATFNTSSESAFKAVATQVDYVKRQTESIASPNFLEGGSETFHVWRTPWLAAGMADVPHIGDRLFALGKFYVVKEVDFTDFDDTLVYQRYRLVCEASKRTATA